MDDAFASMDGDWKMSAAGHGDANGDGRDDLLIAASFDEYFGAQLGAVYLFTEPVSGVIDGDMAAARLHGMAYNGGFGHTAVFAGDVDGDGLDDIAVASHIEGHVELFLAPFEGDSLSEIAAARISTTPSGKVVESVGRAGDMDEDGVPDLIVGARYGDFIEYGVVNGAVRGGPRRRRGTLAGAFGRGVRPVGDAFRDRAG